MLRARGFTYLWLLFIVAVLGASLAAAQRPWRLAVQRDREEELVARAQQIASAIGAYHAATPAGTPAWPLSLDDLVDDRRAAKPLHHLRRVYADPLTGQADWVLVRDAGGGIHSLRSRSDAVAVRAALFAPDAVEHVPVHVSQRWFTSEIPPAGAGFGP